MPRYSIDDWTAVKERLRLGDSIRECAKSTGVDRGAVFKWSHMDRPPGSKRGVPKRPLLDLGADSLRSSNSSYGVALQVLLGRS